MAESTLSVTYEELQAIEGDEMGLGRTPSAWPAAEIPRATEILKQALRNVYVPSLAIPGVPPGFQWSFLTQTTTIPTVAATEWVTLPDNFGAFVSPQLTFDTAATISYAPVQYRDLMVYQDYKRACLGLTRFPSICTIVSTPKTVDGKIYPRWNLGLLPIPDAIYTLRYFFRVLPDVISSTVLPYGGMEIAEVLIASVLASVERRLNRGREKQEAFARQLLSAVNADVTRTAGNMGKNLDPNARYGFPVDYRVFDHIYINGVEP